MTRVLACIDGSPSTAAVCDGAIWASRRLGLPLTFLHVLDRGRYPEPGDLSGAIGLGSREHLLDELARLDERRAKVALEHGQAVLEAARDRAVAAGLQAPELCQRHGSLVETLAEMADGIRLLVIGRQGEDSRQHAGQPIGSQLENVTRALARPILIVPDDFREPGSLLLAYDASPTAEQAVRMLAGSPLVKGLPLHLLMVGEDNALSRTALHEAQALLEVAGFVVIPAIREGDIEPVLHAYQQERAIDLLAMGAYGHSRIRRFLLGSTTSHMLHTSLTSLLLLR
ncbi:universal stress protein [Azotobacter salinestris]|uniref:universal stress protein n=1 Tax=Azotobacter salinestris TaxID=69964 RepID=UPI0012668CEE|nr:universal stress protein [Azotobacter salinestris]